MPAYPYPVAPHAQPDSKARLRSSLTRSLAALMRGRHGAAFSPERLATARILLMRPDHLGDLLFLGPALHWLRARLPEAHITLAIGPWAKPALPALAGAYNDIIELPFPAFERGARAGVAARWGLLPRWARRLRANHYDIALIARPDHWWGAMLASFAGIPVRLGFDTPETAPWLSQALPVGSEHAAASNLRLLAALTGEQLTPDPAAFPLHFELTSRSLDATDALLLNSFGMEDPHPLAIIHPGSGASVKLWEDEKWREVAMYLNNAGARVLVTGGPSETALTRAASAVPAGNVVDIGGQTSFSTLAALLARADIALGPDSGPLHLAVAVGTPTVHLFGPSDQTLFGPWGDSDEHIVVASNWTCAPCGKFDWPDLPAHGCVRDIAVAQVLAAIRKLLNARDMIL